MTSKFVRLGLLSEARDSPKLYALSNWDFRIWFDLFCFAAEQPVPGKISGLDREALALEVAEGVMGVLDKALDELRRLRIISITEGGDISFVGWDGPEMPGAASEENR